MSEEIHHYKDREKSIGSDKTLVIETEKSNRQKPLNKFLYWLGAFIVLLVLLGFAWLNFALRPLTQESEDYKYIQIDQGQSISAIAHKLSDGEVIRSWYAFSILSRIDGTSLQAGYYKLSPSMTTNEILEKIKNGETDAYSITIPEGYRVLQIVKLFNEKIGIDPALFVAAAIGSEGHLFPDTYVFPKNSEPATIIKQMKDNYEKRSRSLNPTEEQLVIASIVEKEAINDEERPKIAALYKKRLDEGMLLQADPTVAYARDTQKYLDVKNVDFKFWAGITRSDYQTIVSPFNTYLNRGLPPAPICNPGLKSLEAAVNPEPNFEYLFFFHDENQEIRFSKTYQEHLEAINKFGVSG